MYFVYLDEAGQTGERLDDPAQPYHILVGLLVPEAKWRAVEQDFEGILVKFIPEKDRYGFEFHAVDVYQGKSYFRKWSRAVRNQIFEMILDLVVKHQLPMTCGVINKPKHAEKYNRPANPHDLSFIFVAERIERFLRKLSPPELGVIISDRNPPNEHRLKGNLKEYRKEGIPLGLFKGKLDHLVEPLFFTSSKDTCFIQIADFCAYLLNKVYTKNDFNNVWYKRIESLIYDRCVFP